LAQSSAAPRDCRWQTRAPGGGRHLTAAGRAAQNGFANGAAALFNGATRRGRGMSETQDFTGTMPVREQHRFDVEPLARWMADHVAGFRGPLTVEQFRGGQSNPTFRLTAGGKHYVLRRKPPGKLLPSAHAVDREYRVLTALQGSGVPVPRTYALCTDEAVIGTWFYVMECVDGRVFWEPHLPDVSKRERFAIYDSLCEVMARLHAVDFRRIGLEDYGRPGNYFARQISRWSKQYYASIDTPLPEMDALCDWLPRSIPPGDDTSIIHGDFKLDNTIVHPTEPRIVAVLDWEISTLGHPLGDFTYLCMPWYRPGAFQSFDLAELGLPTLAQFAATYCARTGRPPIDHFAWYEAFHQFRNACILQGILGRVRDGTASSEHATTLATSIEPMVRAAFGIAKSLGM
jgi:aminoglycoside phosphotransferase (APT) family kinase protein